jgi:hypothetical protein
MEELGIDPTEAMPNEADYERAENAKEYVDPILEKINNLEQENTIAFRISQEGYDSVYNIGEHWTYDMVKECLDYIDAVQEYRDREQRRSDAQSAARNR